MKQVLVLGGTGFVGRHLCEKLQRAGWQTTVPTRRATNASAVQHLPRLTVVEASVHDEATLARLMSGHDAVVNLVAILHGDQTAFERAHVQLPATIARACQASGVRRLVHISALGAQLDGPSMYQRSKARGEEVLRSAGLALSILRPSVIFGDGDRFLNLFARLQTVFPVMPLAGARTRFQPVWVEDVADAVIACLRDTGLPRSSVGQTFECAGPEVLTLAELVRLAGRLGSRERLVLPVPTALGRLQALAMECLPGEPLMSRDNLDSMAVDNVATSQWPGLSSLGIVPRSVHSVAPLYLGRQAVRQRLDRLRSGGR
ncbi:complex I NDUFA9 subunit family protein [Hydrogenophaga pseudoflava]|uniref:complex I NDUFA9 subunit family protein n=1 Tax=Hydrogenophaga pseudoflava TaxID=47421 RepID=UPI0027E5936B|nr:complex I NDUFA9 subunit family protein [Hydrogenophaga pseudoflava]MDQ7743651.1 complex I NDUFA9 subunit family protein [Hydrogenophaga pseudoflava]